MPAARACRSRRGRALAGADPELHPRPAGRGGGVGRPPSRRRPAHSVSCGRLAAPLAPQVAGPGHDARRTDAAAGTRRRPDARVPGMGRRSYSRPDEVVDLIDDDRGTARIEAEMLLTRWGSSMATAGSAGGLCVTGTTRTSVPPSSCRSIASTITQGRHLRPSSRPARCSSIPEIGIGNDQAGLRIGERHTSAVTRPRAAHRGESCSGPIRLTETASISASVRSVMARGRRARALRRCISSYSTAEMKYPVGRPWLVTATGLTLRDLAVKTEIAGELRGWNLAHNILDVF